MISFCDIDFVELQPCPIKEQVQHFFSINKKTITVISISEIYANIFKCFFLYTLSD